MYGERKRAAVCSAAAALLWATCAGAVSGERATPAGLEALDYAFRFASAIHSDPKDRSKAQASVVLDLASIGALDQAVASAEHIEGWHRGAAYADLATVFAQEGRPGTARELLAQADSVRTAVTGWHAPRISAHIAQALAQLGDVEAARNISADLSAGDPQQYGGRSVTTVVAAYAAQGEFERGMQELAKLDEAQGIDVTWWRTAGFVALAREEGLSRAQRVQAIEAARRSANGVPGWKKAEALESIAETLQELGKRKSAREALNVAEEIVLALPESLPVKPALLSNLARGWVKGGATDHARRLLRKAEQIVPSTVVIDRPAMYANVASTYAVLADDQETWRVYGEAVTATESLVNARPRALAAVAVCRSIGRLGLELRSDTRERLDSLFSGLGEPW